MHAEKKSTTNTEEFLQIKSFPSEAYNQIVGQINLAYDIEGLESSVYILVRKLFENSLIDTLRKKFGHSQLRLYFNKNQGQFHSFSMLLRNFEHNLTDFQADFPGIKKELILKLKRFKWKGDASAHSIVEFKTRKQLDADRPDIRNVTIALFHLMKQVKEKPVVAHEENEQTYPSRVLETSQQHPQQTASTDLASFPSVVPSPPSAATLKKDINLFIGSLRAESDVKIEELHEIREKINTSVNAGLDEESRQVLIAFLPTLKELFLPNDPLFSCTIGILNRLARSMHKEIKLLFEKEFNELYLQSESLKPGDMQELIEILLKLNGPSLDYPVFLIKNLPEKRTDFWDFRFYIKIPEFKDGSSEKPPKVFKEFRELRDNSREENEENWYNHFYRELKERWKPDS